MGGMGRGKTMRRVGESIAFEFIGTKGTTLVMSKLLRLDVVAAMQVPMGIL